MTDTNLQSICTIKAYIDILKLVDFVGYPDKQIPKMNIGGTFMLKDSKYGDLDLDVSINVTDPMFKDITDSNIDNLFALARLGAIFESETDGEFPMESDIAHTFVLAEAYTETMCWYYLKAVKEGRPMSISDYGLTPDNIILTRGIGTTIPKEVK